IAGSRSSSSSSRGKNHDGLIKYGFSLVKGKANHPMEDYHVAKFVQIQGHELGLFAIYDGHLGDSVPTYLHKHLFPNILKEEEFWAFPDRSISKAYESTDHAILSEASNLGHGGSTAVTAILINGQRLLVANVGDSRAVLSRGGDVPRVNGQLVVSRAFGDKSLKSHLRSDSDVREANIDNSTDILILASDVLWKVMSNQEAVDIAKKSRNPHKVARQLTTEAVHRDSKDDISCVVIRFRG
ncbi:Probable protein phosphatase 2C 10, partial [Linum perenne]